MKILSGNSGCFVRESERFPGFGRSGIPQRAGFKRVSGWFSVVLLPVLVMVLATLLAAGSQAEAVSEGPGGVSRGALGPNGFGRVIIYSSHTNSCEAFFDFHPPGVIQSEYIEPPRQIRDSRTFQKKNYRKIAREPGNGTRVAPCFRQQAGARKVHAVGAQVLGVQGFTGGGTRFDSSPGANDSEKIFQKIDAGVMGVVSRLGSYPGFFGSIPAPATKTKTAECEV